MHNDEEYKSEDEMRRVIGDSSDHEDEEIKGDRVDKK